MATTSDTDIPGETSASDDPRKKTPLYELIADDGPNPLQGRTVTWDSVDGRQKTGTFLFNVRAPDADGRKYAYVQYPEDVTGTLREMPVAVDRLRIVDDMVTPEEAPQDPLQNQADTTAQPTAGPENKRGAAPSGPGNRETFITGEQGPEISDEERQRRAAILAMQMREIDEEDMRRAEEERARKKDGGPQGPQQERSRIGNLYTRWGLMIQTYDDFFTVKGGQQAANSPVKQVNDAQLKAMILTAALEKNWHTIYFYKDRSTIDPSLTSRAQQMIMELQRPGQPLEGFAMRASTMRMREVEPWNQGRPLYGLFRDAANYKDDTIRSLSNGLSSRWNSVVTGTMFTAKAADAAPQPETADRTQTEKATPGEPVAEAAAETIKRANPAAVPGAAR